MDFEISALQSLQEAYQLFPNDVDKRMNRFLNLFADQYNDTNWNVADNCSLLYLPGQTIGISLKVEDTNTEFVKIFNSTQDNNSTSVRHQTISHRLHMKKCN